MRVMLVSHRFPPDGIAGVERITQSLAGELVRLGDEVSVATRWPNEASPLETVRERLTDGTKVFRFSGGRDVLLDRFLAYHEQLERMFAAALAETSPDVVHVMHTLGLSPRFLDLARRHGAAVVVSLQDFFFACPLILLRKVSGENCRGPEGGRECMRTCFAREGAFGRRWGDRTTYFRRLLSLANRVICPSKYVVDFFEKFGVDADRIRNVPNGVTIPAAGEELFPRPTPKSRGVFNIAFAGSVVVHKGAHLIVEACRLAKLGRVNLAIFGTAPDAAYLNRLREDAAAVPGLELKIYGSYEPQQLPILLADVDVAITPSTWPETFAIVVREALTRNIPVIVSQRGGLPEAVNYGENGFTFNPDQPGELAALLQRFVKEDDLLPRLRIGAASSKVLSAAGHAAAVRAVYDEAIDDLLHHKTFARGDSEELNFLHTALLEQGFGAVV